MSLLKFILFFNQEEEFTKAISQRVGRRRDGDDFYYCKLDSNLANFVKKDSATKIRDMKNGITNSKRQKEKYVPDVNSNGYSNDRYLAINVQNSSTIEIRLFKSNMDEVSFRKNIEFLDCLYWYTKENSINDFSVENFIKFANTNKKDYNNLLKFLKRSNFINI